MEGEEIFDQIQEILGKLPANLNILQQQIDINLQMEYYKAAKKNREKPIEKIISKKDLLFSDTISMAEKKWLLIRLAALDSVEAYRTIEKFVIEGDPDLHDWATLAYQESRMIIESSLLDENQVFISTGLGGKGSKLRYFIVLLSNNGDDFSPVQQKVVQSEFEYIFAGSQAEIEQVDFTGSFATILTVIPIQVPIKNLLTKAVEECNQFGDFIRQDFIVTNVKTLSFNEIKDLINKHKIT